MNVPNIVMTRIDERLVHGQGGLWIKTLSCNTVIVANDEVANDPISQSLMRTVVPKEIALRFYPIQKVIDIIYKAHPSQTIFILIKNCEDALKLVSNNVPIKKINIGNIHNGEDKEKITRSIFLSKQDKEYLKIMIDKYNIDFDTKTTPHGNDGSLEIDIKKYL